MEKAGPLQDEITQPPEEALAPAERNLDADPESSDACEAPTSSLAQEGAEPLVGALSQLSAALSAGFAQTLEQFRTKLAYDRFKEEQITRLHEELQTYRTELVQQPARQLLQGLVRLHDDLGKVEAALRRRPPEELTPDLLFRQLDDFRDDLELLLAQHGAQSFEQPGESFDPQRQTALRTVPTDDPGKVGRIARRLRPGFELAEWLLTKERVAVYAAIQPTEGEPS